jgi:hypothetical protein
VIQAGDWLYVLIIGKETVVVHLTTFIQTRKLFVYRSQVSELRYEPFLTLSTYDRHSIATFGNSNAHRRGIEVKKPAGRHWRDRNGFTFDLSTFYSA